MMNDCENCLNYKPKEEVPEYVKKSIERWEYILRDAKEGGVKVSGGGNPRDLTYTRCGYCDKFNTDCQKCSLYPKYCQQKNPTTSAPTQLYWRICGNLKNAKAGRDDEETIKLIEEMLEAVKTAWKKPKEPKEPLIDRVMAELDKKGIFATWQKNKASNVLYVRGPTANMPMFIAFGEYMKELYEKYPELYVSTGWNNHSLAIEGFEEIGRREAMKC